MKTHTIAARTAAVIVAVAAGIPLSACASDAEPAGQLSPREETPSMSDTASTEKVAKELVGMSEADAVALAESKGLSTRVIERDGEPLPATMDLREDRINLVITEGEVTRATVG